ncbi:MAG: YXWGXW repeat-containing protein [Myxococcales bacterium]|nr:YXWGXW repeat-containing protein [Myxococcales bacterium]
MKRLARSLLPLLVAGGCGSSTVRARATVAVRDDAPPPAREEVMVYRPGFVWIHGHWDRDRGHWRWKPGYYERERPGYVYIQGRWEPSSRGYVWVDGRWHKREGIAIRERRF